MIKVFGLQSMKLSFPHPHVLGLKRSKYDREKYHRQEIRYGLHCARELLDHHRRPAPLDDLPLIQDWMNTHFPAREYQRPLLEPLPIPGGRGECNGRYYRESIPFMTGDYDGNVGFPPRLSASVLSTKHLMADPMIIRRQEEDNPFHPAKINPPGHYEMSRYRFSVPQMHLSDLADTEQPFEDKIVKMFTMIQMGRTEGKSQPLPFYSTAVFARWLWNQRMERPPVQQRLIGSK